MRWRPLTFFLVAVVAALSGIAAEKIPPAPPNHFNDYAGIVKPEVAAQLEQELTDYERESSNQLLVAIYPHMQSDSSIEDYTVRVAQAWKVGQKDRRNGAVLFIFSNDRKLFIQVGYGLEAVLPDARCKQIVENEITPRFRAGDFSGGVAAGVHAMILSTRGEYQGKGGLVAEQHSTASRGLPPFAVFIGIVAFIVFLSFRRRRTYGYRRGGRFFPVYTGGSNWGGGGGWGGGGSGGGGGGSFSGGGGSFGGGGAGGSW
jgi:uncharacterized protein